MNPTLSLHVRHLFREDTFPVTDPGRRTSRRGDRIGRPKHSRLKARDAERAVALDSGPALRRRRLVLSRRRLARRIDAMPITRDHIARAEARLRALDGGTARPRAPVGKARLAG